MRSGKDRKSVCHCGRGSMRRVCHGIRSSGAQQNSLRIRGSWRIVNFVMNKLFTIAVAVLALTAFSATSFAGSCGSCPGEGGDKAKDKDKTEQGSAS